MHTLIYSISFSLEGTINAAVDANFVAAYGSDLVPGTALALKNVS
jgi:hypothetical protein